MTDLTKIEKPFGLLDPKTQRALRECGGPWDIYTSYEGWKRHYGTPLFTSGVTYRKAPPPVTYPQPPWEVIDRRWNWFAKHEDGTGWFYEHEPERKCVYWESEYDIEGARALSFDYGTCDWKDSLVRRPE